APDARAPDARAAPYARAGRVQRPGPGPARDGDRRRAPARPAPGAVAGLAEHVGAVLSDLHRREPARADAGPPGCAEAPAPRGAANARPRAGAEDRRDAARRPSRARDMADPGLEWPAQLGVRALAKEQRSDADVDVADAAQLARNLEPGRGREAAAAGVDRSVEAARPRGPVRRLPRVERPLLPAAVRELRLRPALEWRDRAGLARSARAGGARGRARRGRVRRLLLQPAGAVQRAADRVHRGPRGRSAPL